MAIKSKAGKTKASAGWMRPGEVCELLCCSDLTLRRSYAGVFTQVRPSGTGAGKRFFYHRDEVELFVETGKAEAVRALREIMKRI